MRKIADAKITIKCSGMPQRCFYALGAEPAIFDALPDLDWASSKPLRMAASALEDSVISQLDEVFKERYPSFSISRISYNVKTGVMTVEWEGNFEREADSNVLPFKPLRKVQEER